MRYLLTRLFDRLRRGPLERELREELRFHRRLLERDYRDRGFEVAESSALAGRRLGRETAITEETRALWSLGWIDELGQNVAFALRSVRRAPSFAIAVTLTLALGVGADTAIFSVVHAVLLAPLPYRDVDRLVSVWTAQEGRPDARNPASYPDLTDWSTQNTVFLGIAGYAFNRFELTGPEGTDQARAALGTRDLFTVLGTNALLGRTPLPDDERERVVAISHRVWQQRYAGRADVLGRSVRLNGDPFTIIGVMPPGFHFPSPDIDLWTSLAPILGDRSNDADNPWLTSRSMRGYRVVARLAAGVSMAAAEREMTALERRLGQTYPDQDGGLIIRLSSIRDDTVGGVRRVLWLLFGAAGFVLVLACANVAHLMLARTSTRLREMSVRRALGADRRRIIAHLLTESGLLAVFGGTVGVLAALAGTRALVRFGPRDIPRLETVHLSGPVLAFAVAASLLTVLLFGVAPALVAWRESSGVLGALRDEGRALVGSRSGGRLRSMLTTAEVTLALITLVGAGLMVRSYALLAATDPGFRSEGRLAFHIGFRSDRYARGGPQVAALERLLGALRELPGVKSAGASTSMPPTTYQQRTSYFVEGEPEPQPGQSPSAIFIPSTADFVSALGIEMVAGRDFRATDDSAAPPVAIVSRQLVRQHFAGREALGKRITVDGGQRTIIGVVGDAAYDGIGNAPSPTVYVPFAQSPFAGVWIAVRASTEPRSLMRAITGIVHALDPEMNPRDLRPMDDRVSVALGRPRFQTWLFGAFGAVALMLAVVGIYGVVAYGVAQRTPEIGLRLALGAPRHSVVREVVVRGMLPVIVGVVAGVVGALALAKLMSGLLYGVAPRDAVTLGAVTTVLTVVAFVAAWVPGLRASRVDPMVALRRGA